MDVNAGYLRILKSELSRRCEKNPRYSLRAFARALRIDVGALSRVINGHEFLSRKTALKVVGCLSLSARDQDLFLNSVDEIHRQRRLKKPSKPFRGKGQIQATDLAVDLYKVIGEWYHIAILELTFIEGFKSDQKWIAQQLGIPVIEAKLAIERLFALGLLERKKTGWVKSAQQLSTSDKHVTTPALKRNQKQFLEKAIYSLENDPIDQRVTTSMTMAIEPELLPQAREMIVKFNEYLCEFLESGKRRRVYNLGIALYPIQQPSKGELR